MRRIVLFLLAAAAAGAESAVDAELFRAIRNDDLAAVRRLLDSGADVNLRDAQGATPLMRAALYASTACLKLLLERGSDPNRANTAGATALMWAAGDPGKVLLLLARKAEVNARAKSGRTPLIVASAIHGNIEAVKLLLDAGADLKARDANGTGPVWAAAAAADPRILAELLARGGDPNEKDTSRRGQTALMNAAAYDSPETVRVLLKAGADVHVQSGPPAEIKAGLQDRGQNTALLWAAPFGTRETIELLLNARADPNVREFRGMNALTLAVTSEKQDAAVTRLLLEKTADVNAKDKNGLTALDWARRWGAGEIVNMLRDSGATGAVAAQPAIEAPRGGYGIRQAVEKSVALMQSSSRQFFRASGCAGCHHQMLGGMLVALAHEKKLAVNEALAAEQIKEILATRMPSRESMLQAQRVGGFPMVDSLLLVSLAAQKYPADGYTDAVVHNLMAFQWSDGSWHGLDQRPPLEYSAFSETAYAIRALQMYAPPGRRADAQRRVRRAADWLVTANASHTEEKAMQLLGLVWADSGPHQTKELATRLLAEQLPDGGWAQRSGFPSDAYATGQVLYALHTVDAAAALNATWQRGIRYLLDTQHEDGSWLVRSRSVKFQPYFESGFPYGHEQWISAAGTAWAAMSLALASSERLPGRAVR